MDQLRSVAQASQAGLEPVLIRSGSLDVMRSAKKTPLSSAVRRKSRRLAVILALGLLVGASALPTSASAASTPAVHVQHLAEGGSGESPPGVG
jgi:hypothetical protein